MTQIRRGTTPTFIVTIDAKLEGFRLFLSFRQRNVILTKTNEDMQIEYDTVEDTTKITYKYTQAECLEFEPGLVDVQVRAVDNDSGETAIATNIATVAISPIIYEDHIQENEGE